MKINEIPELTKISSKGQLVIPSEIRKDLHIKEGDVFATTSANDMIILKKVRNVIMREDLRILQEVEKAWKEIENGKFRTMEKNDFLEEIKKW